MLVQPSVQLKDSAFTDHDRVASSNLRLNFPSTEDPITTHCKDGEGTGGFLTIGRLDDPVDDPAEAKSECRRVKGQWY